MAVSSFSCRERLGGNQFIAWKGTMKPQSRQNRSPIPTKEKEKERREKGSVKTTFRGKFPWPLHHEIDASTVGISSGSLFSVVG